MKKLLKTFFGLMVSLLMVSCFQQKEYYVFTSFHEPATDGLRFLYSEDGIHWDSIPGTWLKPTIGKQKVLRDPSIVRTPDGMFRLVWTTSWKGDRGFGYAESRDLKTWSEPRFVGVMSDTSTVNVWAPELFYDPETRQAMVVWASCVPDAGFDVGEEEVDNNHRLYYVTTRDFERFSETRLLLDPGFSCIDATIFKRNQGEYVMVLKDNTRPERNLKVSFAKNPEGPWSAPSPSFTGFKTEGPTVVEADSGYVVYYDDYNNKRYGASYTKDFIDFQDYSDVISVPAHHKHGTVFKAPASVVEGLLGE